MGESFPPEVPGLGVKGETPKKQAPGAGGEGSAIPVGRDSDLCVSLLGW